MRIVINGLLGFLEAEPCLCLSYWLVLVRLLADVAWCSVIIVFCVFVAKL